MKPQTLFEDEVRVYTTDAKDRRRAMVAYDFARVADLRGARLLYLEGPCAEATRFFLGAGLSRASLEPITRDPDACKGILAHTGLKPTQGDIFDVLAAGRRVFRKGTVAWVDLEQNTVDEAIVLKTLTHADVVHIDLTCRAEQPRDVIARALATLVALGVKKSSVDFGKYSGTSGHTSMVWLRVEGTA